MGILVVAGIHEVAVAWTCCAQQLLMVHSLNLVQQEHVSRNLASVFGLSQQIAGSVLPALDETESCRMCFCVASALLTHSFISKLGVFSLLSHWVAITALQCCKPCQGATSLAGSRMGGVEFTHTDERAQHTKSWK